jgi:hypothetical protein
MIIVELTKVVDYLGNPYDHEAVFVDGKMVGDEYSPDSQALAVRETLDLLGIEYRFEHTKRVWDEDTGEIGIILNEI